MSQAIQSPQVSIAATGNRQVPADRVVLGDRYDLRDPAYQAYQILHLGFTVAPIIAGADKFFHLLVNWDNYLAPAVNRVLGGHGHTFMLAAGVIEIVAGVGVFLRPRLFAYVVAAWLLGIIANLLLFPPSHPFPHYDVALRDLGLCLGALALGRLSGRFARSV